MDLKKIYKFISYNVLVVISVWIFSVYFMDFNPTFFWIDSNWYLFFDLFPGDSHGSLNFSFYTSLAWGCLLYTSDAADEHTGVDLGGRRIIKKKIF